MRVIVTGGAGFIGSALVRRLVAQGDQVLNIDKLTYAGDLRTLADCEGRSNYRFLRGDIADAAAMEGVFADFQPNVVMHLAAESHVDRSIDSPGDFLATNVMGTYALLDAALGYWRGDGGERLDFRFVAVSTDEVYGSLGQSGRFLETSPYAPNSPYAASKAAADHLARAWNRTFGLPVIVTNCSNNHGPFQHPEKLIPTVLRSALSGRDIPVYGKGENVRDWLHVNDHVEGLLTALAKGSPGQNYNFGGNFEVSNIDLVKRLCAILDERVPANGRSYSQQIVFVPDRPGHDLRYAVDCTKAEAELGWSRRFPSDSGLQHTVDWYLENRDWLESKKDAGRLGLARAGGV